MKRETYIKMTETVRSSEMLNQTVLIADGILTKVSYVVYPVFLAFVFIKKEPEAALAFAVPAISFILLSIFRSIYNAPRPYEVFEAPPVITKDTKGKSFPSRHVFSAFIIAATVFQFYQLPGILLGVLAFLMAIVRVVGGVHFVKDVTAGTLIGILCAVIGFNLF